MAKQEQEQLVEIFAKTAKTYTALMMYYDNLATDRMEYAEEEFTSLDVENAKEDLNDLDQFIQASVGYSVEELLEQYDINTCMHGLPLSQTCNTCEE